MAEQKDCIQVVLAFPSVIEAFEGWLHARGQHLFPIPVGADDLPTYGIAPDVLPPRQPSDQPEVGGGSFFACSCGATRPDDCEVER